MAGEKKTGKIIIIVLLALIVLGGSVFGGVYFYMSKNAEPKEVVIIEGYKEIGDIMVNLSDESGKKYAKLNASVTYDSANEQLAAEIDNNIISLKDTTIFYLKSLQSTDFTANNELNLKKQLVDKLNSNLKTGLIIDVKFNELLVQ